MVDAATDVGGCSSASPRWSPREIELLAVALRLLQQRGYDGLTMDAVAEAAHASKATLYRRWPTKIALVVAAYVESARNVPAPPRSGTLRGDLLCLGELICQQVREHAPTLRAVLVEVPRQPALSDALERHFLAPRKYMVERVLQQAVDRGEIEDVAITDELAILMPRYLLGESIVANRTPTERTVRALVDSIMIPSLTACRR